MIRSISRNKTRLLQHGMRVRTSPSHGTNAGAKRLFLSKPPSHQGDIGANVKEPWQAQHNTDIQRVTQNAIIHELTRQQNSTIEDVVPWFLQNMPSCYFRQVPEQFRMDHIKAISAIRDANMDVHMNLKSQLPDGRLVLTYIRPGREEGQVLSLVKDLPSNFESKKYLPLSRVHLFHADDDSMSLSIFVYGEESSTDIDVEKAGAHIIDYMEQTKDEDDSISSHICDKESLLNYFRQCKETYLIRSNPRRFLEQKELFKAVSGTENLEVSITKAEEKDEVGDYWIDIAVANSLPQVALENATIVLHHNKFDVVRSHLDIVSDGDNGDVCQLRMLVTPFEDSAISEDTFKVITHDLKRTKWMDPKTMDLVFRRYPDIGVTRAEIITAFCSLLHSILAPQNQFAFSMGNIHDVVTEVRYMKYATSIADLFLDRFNPHDSITDEEFNARSNELISAIKTDVEDTTAATILLKMNEIVRQTLRTNVYLKMRYSLGLRLNPKIMSNRKGTKELPYGLIFSHGRRFNAFHVRFQDIARGGMRLVTPPNPEQFALESSRQYDECYGLAFAQNLKNKDIPEGGSKAVALINCNGLSEQSKQFVMRKSVKAFSDTILDLIIDTDETRENVVDYLGKKEVIYLGPDEQVTVEDISWITKRAEKRGYGIPNAFMSSKPTAGINHKEFGVTSEGVNTFLDVALQEVLNINPREQEFTIKMTGGPDGDVAGNEIKILVREFGTNAKIVGIADATGCAEDPDGLDQEELLLLVENNLSISNFNSNKLGTEGKVYLASNEKGAKARDTMHNRLKADAFIPAGGRPNTIDINNYQNFMMPDGTTPSSPLIVEGANLFITAEARQALYDDAGVAIVKDSSANKCGVIASSYEICAAMMVSENEFYEHKEEIVNDVLTKLRGFADVEARLLFREFAKSSESLPHISQVISNVINDTTHAIARALDSIPKEEQDELLPLFREHLPESLSVLAFDKVSERIPEQYIKNAIASCLASKIVYKEGTDFVASIPKKKLASFALDYVSKEKDIAKLKASLKDVDMPESEKEEIIRLLHKGGVRTALS